MLTVKHRSIASLLVALSLLSGATAIDAKQMGDVQLQPDAGSQIDSDTNTIQKTAQQWGLTKDEYKQYLKEMNKPTTKRWWQHLDPPQVLGMNAKSQAERMQYARIDAKLDHERASKEIAFQHAYSKAYAQLYPQAKLIAINTGQHGARQAVRPGDRFYVLTKLDDPEGAMLVSQVLQLMRSQSNVSLNIFFVGQAFVTQINQWGRRNNIPASMPHHNQVTLNHNQHNGNNMLKHLMKTTQVTLPVVVRVRDGQSQVIKMESL